jgi:hypothetical protein
MVVPLASRSRLIRSIALPFKLSMTRWLPSSDQKPMWTKRWPHSRNDRTCHQEHHGDDRSLVKLWYNSEQMNFLEMKHKESSCWQSNRSTTGRFWWRYG